MIISPSLFLSIWSIIKLLESANELIVYDLTGGSS